jgi:hypothetical protein
MSLNNGTLCCDMAHECKAAVTHIDEKGFVYCADHGATRKNYCRCRQLFPKELRTLRSGTPIHYDPKRNK